MKFLKEQLVPIIKYLADRSLLVPVIAMVGIGYGIHLKYVTGDTGMYGIVTVAVAVTISKIFTKGK